MADLRAIFPEWKRVYGENRRADKRSGNTFPNP